MTESIKVFVRVRPFGVQKDELSKRCLRCEDGSIQVVDDCSIGNPFLTFNFDEVFDEGASQSEVYQKVASPLIESAFEGYNATIFCYGQTASGKTYTCVGDSYESRGILPRVFEDMLRRIPKMADPHTVRFKLEVIEIYNEKINDLLDPGRKNLVIRHDQQNVYVEGAHQCLLKEARDASEALRRVRENRTMGATQMNYNSSRSHVLFFLTLFRQDQDLVRSKIAKVTLVDLAGSEKTAKTGAEGRRLEESININVSLSALGNVISALSQGLKNHIPYRDSQLTRLLQESLAGNAKTSLIINVSPCKSNELETVTSLRFGQRAKTIVLAPRANKVLSPQDLAHRLLLAEREILRQARLIASLRAGLQADDDGAKEYSLYLLEPQADRANRTDNLSQRSVRKPASSKSYAVSRQRGTTLNQCSSSRVLPPKLRLFSRAIEEEDKVDDDTLDNHL